jgi:2-(3-amino-3-carboxypropyl)histidine synthase
MALLLDKKIKLEEKLESLKLEIARKQEIIQNIINKNDHVANDNYLSIAKVVEAAETPVEVAANEEQTKQENEISTGMKRKFRGKKSQGQTANGLPEKRFSRVQEFEMPRDLVENEELDDAIGRTLPRNYNFEVKKTIWRIRRCSAKKVAIQLPEGLLLFAPSIADLLERFGGVEISIFADVTYGACCVDDFAARALGCELLVHYGHSCLVPVDITSKSPSTEDANTVQVMYVFVDVNFDLEHMVDSIKLEFPSPDAKLALLGTIQFAGTLHAAKSELDKFYVTSPVLVPQAKPLSGGEVLGCTSPTLPQTELDAFIFVADGRFHLESAMIANPTLPALRYDPYSKVFTKEAYDSAVLLTVRSSNISRARNAKRWGVILGTLGRQGNPAILRRIIGAIQDVKRDAEVMVILMSELSPTKLSAMEEEIDVWVQIACPRLSIDWADAFSKKPLLTPYECFVALGKTEWRESSYPQDFYAKGSGPWTNYYEPPKNSLGA